MSVIDKIQINNTTYDVGSEAGIVAYDSTETYSANTVGGEINQLKSGFTELDATVDTMADAYLDVTTSTNVYTPVRTQLFPQSGSCTIDSDKTINITEVPGQTNVWIYGTAENETITLEAGDYVLCIDSGLYEYGQTVIVFQAKVGSATFSDGTLVTATGDRTAFSIPQNITAQVRFAYYASYASYSKTWSGHIWINKGSAQEYMPVGAAVSVAKDFIDANQGSENASKLFSVGNDGSIALIPNTTINKTLYQRGNLIDYSKVTTGYIGSDGTVQSVNYLWCSDFCPVQSGNVYVYCGPAIATQYFAFYDESKALVASYSTLGTMTRYTSGYLYYVAVPNGAKYFRCTFSSDQTNPSTATAWASQSAETPLNADEYSVYSVYPYTLNPDNPCDYSELTVRAFSKVVCIGDSLTYGGFNMSDSGTSTGQTLSSTELSTRYSYPSNFQRITGIDTTNKGDSGATTVSWYEAHQNDDFSDFDLAIIFLGVNDSAFSVSDADTLTAMGNIVTMLNTARSDMRIAICSCIPAYDGAGYQAKGQLIYNWAVSQNDPNIIPLDLAKYSHTLPRTSYVAGHLSALGYYMMALDIARYISWYMDNNKRDFRFIQFIGSPDAEWSYD